MRRKLFFGIIFIVTILLFGFYFSQREDDQKEKMKTQKNFLDQSTLQKLKCTNCNVIIISLEPLRFSNMSLYGYGRKTTPNIDKFSKNSLVFNNFISVSPWTLPAHMSLFTGVYPSRHKITNKFGLTKTGEEFENNLQKVSPGLKTLTEILKENGYKTAGFTGGAADNSSFGFDKGFDVYKDTGDFVGLSENISDAAAWMRENKSGKFFVFLQGYDMHGQYVPKGGYDKRFVDFDYKGKLSGSKDEQKDLREEGVTRGEIFLTPDDVQFLMALYDEKIQRMDEEFGRFLENLRGEEILDKTILVFLSGHGEEFYEHGRIDHGHSLYEELIHVPLVINIPGLEKEVRVDGQFSIVDIMPTILDLLGGEDLGEVPGGLDGNSIVDDLKAGVEDEEVYLETDYRYSVFKRGIRTSDGWKIIEDLETKKTELYNVNVDREEKENTAEKETEIKNKLLSTLEKHLYSFK